MSNSKKIVMHADGSASVEDANFNDILGDVCVQQEAIDSSMFTSKYVRQYNAFGSDDDIPVNFGLSRRRIKKMIKATRRASSLQHHITKYHIMLDIDKDVNKAGVASRNADLDLDRTAKHHSDIDAYDHEKRILSSDAQMIIVVNDLIGLLKHYTKSAKTGTAQE